MLDCVLEQSADLTSHLACTEVGRTIFQAEHWQEWMRQTRHGSYADAPAEVQNLWLYCYISMMPKISKKWKTQLSLRTGITRQGVSGIYDTITISDEALLRLVMSLKFPIWIEALAEQPAQDNVAVHRRTAGRQRNRVGCADPAGQSEFMDIFTDVREQRTRADAASWKDAIVNAVMTNFYHTRDARQDGRAQQRAIRGAHPPIRLPVG